jgi:hypothetical protein
MTTTPVTFNKPVSEYARTLRPAVAAFLETTDWFDGAVIHSGTIQGFETVPIAGKITISLPIGQHIIEGYPMEVIEGSGTGAAKRLIRMFLPPDTWRVDLVWAMGWDAEYRIYN